MAILRVKDGDEWLEIEAIKGDTGPKGDTGDSGVYIGDDAPTDPVKNVWIDTDDGETVVFPTKTSDLVNDSGFITTETDPIFSNSVAGSITSTDITNWNNKTDFSGNYNDLTNKPTIPSKTSDLTNDSGFITNSSVPTKTSDLTNDSGFITNSSIPTSLSSFTDDLGSNPTHTHSQYLTSYTETDPVFTASAAHGITSSNISTWNGKLDSSKVKNANSTTAGDVYDVRYINTMLGDIESLLGGI